MTQLTTIYEIALGCPGSQDSDTGTVAMSAGPCLEVASLNLHAKPPGTFIPKPLSKANPPERLPSEGFRVGCPSLCKYEMHPGEATTPCKTHALFAIRPIDFSNKDPINLQTSPMINTSTDTNVCMMHDVDTSTDTNVCTTHDIDTQVNLETNPTDVHMQHCTGHTETPRPIPCNSPHAPASE